MLIFFSIINNKFINYNMFIVHKSILSYNFYLILHLDILFSSYKYIFTYFTQSSTWPPVFGTFTSTFWGSKTASIFFSSIFSDRKVNLVGTLSKVKSKRFLIVIKWAEKNKRKNGNFYSNLVFEKIDSGFWCNSTTNDHIFIQFSLILHISIFYTRYNFQNILICF